MIFAPIGEFSYGKIKPFVITEPDGVRLGDLRFGC